MYSPGEVWFVRRNAAHANDPERIVRLKTISSPALQENEL